MRYITDAYYEYVQRLTSDSKEDIQRFIDKFGQDTYELFLKSKDRLKNNNVSTDIAWHTKHTDVDAMKEMLYALRSKVASNENPTKIAGSYNFIGSIAGYQVYQPLDVNASMAFGVGSSWCITGRYGHAGDLNFKPSYNDAKRHWDSYTSKGIKFFFYLQDGIAKYAVCVYPQTFTAYLVDGKLTRYVNNKDKINGYTEYKLNVEIYDQNDNLVILQNETSMTLIESLQVNKLPNVKIIYEEHNMQAINATTIAGAKLYIANGVLTACAANNVAELILPQNVTRIEKKAFENATINTLIIKHNVVIDGYAFLYARINVIKILGNVTLKEAAFITCDVADVYLPESIKTLPDDCFNACKNLKFLNILNNLTDVGNGCFNRCYSLTFDNLPKWPNVFSKIDECKLNVEKITVDESMLNNTNGGIHKLISINGVKTIAFDDLEYIDVLFCKDLVELDAQKITRFLAVKYCNNLTTIKLGKHIDRIYIMGTNKVHIYADDIIIINDIFIDEHKSRADAYLHNIIFHTKNQSLIDFCKYYKIKYVLEE